MRRLLLGISVLISGYLMAQDGTVPLEHFLQMKHEMAFKDSIAIVHSAIKPYSYWTVQKAIPDTSGLDVSSIKAVKRKKTYVRIAPLLGLRVFNQAGASALQGYENYIGGSAGAGIGNKMFVSFSAVHGWGQPPSNVRLISDSLTVMPGYGYKVDRGDNIVFDQISFRLAWKPTSFLELSGGRGKNSIGDGYRSLLLSDFAPNYNFGRADFDIWKIRYMVLYSQMAQTEDYPTSFYPTDTKYSTMHYLSINLTNWWTVGAFESIVWEQEDSVVNRNYDIQYLNPVIFFRPVEYSLGSSDNSLMGFTSSIRPIPSLTLYGQVLLDEFLFSEVIAPIRARRDPTVKTGWWANKQAFQLGVKYLEPFGWKDASTRVEFNLVRPFTYGHSNRRQSYTHLNQSLAHPLGSNFIEWVQVTTWQPKRWRIGLFTTYARKGYSNNLGFLGEDPLVSNAERDKDKREHGNFLLQGRLVDIANVRAIVGYTIVKDWNMRLETSLHYRAERSAQHFNEQFIFGFGLRTALWNEERNF